jgi:hypothetical protein
VLAARRPPVGQDRGRAAAGRRSAFPARVPPGAVVAGRRARAR